MKKTTLLSMITLAPFIATAQDSFPGQNAHLNMEVFNICATILVIVLVMVFVLSTLKRVLDYRIKNKIADKGISENLASSILQPNAKEDGSSNIKWFSILAGLGTGLTIINYTMPLGVHSFAIMSFSIAASFLGYHYFLKHSQK
jgi:hypothetical protein